MAKAKTPAQSGGELLHRDGTIEATRAAEGEAETRTADISFSSEIRAERWFGGEILDHTPGAARMGFIAGGRAPLLMHHDGRQVVGVVTKASIDSDKKGRATVRFSKSAAGEAAMQDVRDGILSNVSVGYRVHDMKLDQKSDDGETYRVTDWEPLEVSLVSIPVDHSVGVGRSEFVDLIVSRARSAFETPPTEIKEITMDPTAQAAADAAALATRNAADAVARTAELSGASLTAATNERTRAKEIGDLAARHNLGALGAEHVDAGTDVASFRGIILEKLGEKGSNKPLAAMPGDLGLNAREKARFSFARAILAQADAQTNKKPVASFERDLSDEIARKCGREARGLFVPYDVMSERGDDSEMSLFKRALTASGGVATGGAVVQNTVLASQYIPPNYNIPVVVSAGARVLSGLQGNVLIPKITTGKVGTWVTPENTAVAPADAVFAQVALSPKDYGTVADISRRLLLQANPAVDGLVRDDIAMAIALGLDQAALVGTGASGQPLGVTGQAGVATVAGGTNGLALTWGNVTYLPQNVGAANRLNAPGAGFITNMQAYAHALRTPKVAAYPTFIAQYEENKPINMIGANAGSIMGVPVHVSQQVPSTLVKGSSGAICSAMYFGVWSDLLIGEWGVMDLLVDPYTFSNSGAIRIRCFVTLDVTCRYGQSFAQIVDILTT